MLKSVKQSGLTFNYKLIFLFNYPENNTNEDLAQLKEENGQFEDLLMPKVNRVAR